MAKFIKLTQLILELKESTQTRLEDIRHAYSESLEYSESMGLPAPKEPKPYTIKMEDYNITEKPYYVNIHYLEDFGEDKEGYNLLSMPDRGIMIKESSEEVMNLINEVNK